MEENNNRANRKVLVSFRISTLLIVLLIVAVSVVAFVKISSNKNAKVETVESTSVQSQDVEEKENKEPVKITARSSEIREMPVVEETQESIQVTGETPEEATQEFEPVVEEAIQAPEQPKTTPIEDVKISVDMDLTVRTGLSREDFIKLISGVKADTSGFFEENAGLIYDVCEKYSLNEIFFCGLISAESGWNIASNHRNTHNYISLMSSGGLIRFSSVEEGMEKAAATLHNRYLTPGGSFYYGPTLAAMKTKFCPASSTWVSLVYGRMSQIIP